MKLATISRGRPAKKKKSRRSRDIVHPLETLYEHWTGCPSCGWRPIGDMGESPEHLRTGIASSIGSRNSQYGTDDYEWYRHVEMIVLRHHPAGTNRRQALDYEEHCIKRDNPPFNKIHNDQYEAQAAVREKYYRRKPPTVRWFSLALFRAKSAGVQALQFGLASGVGILIGKFVI